MSPRLNPVLLYDPSLVVICDALRVYIAHCILYCKDRTTFSKLSFTRVPAKQNVDTCNQKSLAVLPCISASL